MHLAYVSTTDRGATDVLLSAFARHLIGMGVVLAGVVQTNTDCGDGAACDMDLQVLPDGDTIRISQSLGRGARGCRLNPSELERAVGLVSQSLAAKPQLLIINKFGKHEADGRGFRPLIAQALENEIPVIVGLNGLNQEKFLGFAEGIASPVAPDLNAMQASFEATAGEQRSGLAQQA